MLMLKAVPPMNFARIDPGESGDRSAIAPNKILKKINARGRRLRRPRVIYIIRIVFGDSAGRVTLSPGSVLAKFIGGTAF